MAAVKLHLKNNNKDYKLKATDRRTKEGRIIYENTKTGEFHSELSMTLEVPEGSGNWINVPSLINGRVYNIQGVLDMLEAGKVTPNSTGHKTEAEAVEAAIYRSNNLQDEVGVSLKPNNEVVINDDYDPVKQAFIDENMQNININTSSTNNDVITPKPIINTDQALNQQILGTDAQSIQDTLRLNELAAMTKDANMASRHPEGKG
jgi:hypothetical protein